MVEETRTNPDAVRSWDTFKSRGSRKTGYKKSGIQQSDIIRLREVEGLSFVAIAKLLKVSPQAVGQRYRYAISKRMDDHATERGSHD